MANNAKKKAEQRSDALQRAAKAREKASAREKKAQGNVDKRSGQLDAALIALKKAAAGSPKAREVEEAARAGLKKLLFRRKKLRKAQKALRRAEEKVRNVDHRADAGATKKARAQASAGQSRKISKTRPAPKRQPKTREKRAARTPGSSAPKSAIKVVSTRMDTKKLRADHRATAGALNKARAQAPAAQSRKVSKTRPAPKRQLESRAKSSATKPTAPDALPAIEAINRRINTHDNDIA